MTKQTFKLGFFALALMLFGISFTPSVAALDDSILDVATENGNFTTLVGALEAAGLDEMLDNNGPFTVFAPTDAAFAAISDAVAGLTETELRQTLLYHMVQGSYGSADVVALDSVTTALGKDISIAVQGEAVILNGSAMVTAVDIAASNGVIHVIDAVLLPPANGAMAPPPPAPAEEAPAPAPVEEAPAPVPVEEAPLTEEAYTLTLMRDIQFSLQQMIGVLDRSPAGQYPNGCNDFNLYYQIGIFSLLEFLFSEPIAGLEGDFEPTVETVLDGMIEAEPVVLLCSNGGNGHLSAHNKGAARAGLVMAFDKISGIIAKGESITGVQSQTQVPDLLNQELTPEEEAFLEEIFGGTFNADIFYEDLLISREIMKEMNGWLDKLANGATVYCNEYVLYYELLSLPVQFFTVPPEWAELYQGHFNALLNVLDTSRPLVIFCIDGGNLSEFNFGLARAGLTQSFDELHLLIQETERRLGVTIE